MKLKKEREKGVCTYSLVEAIGEGRVVAPRESLVVGEAAGALGFEVEESDGERVVIVMG